MKTADKRDHGCCEFISPLRMVLLVVNAICFGGFVVLLCTGRQGGGPMILAMIGSGLLLGAGLVGAVIASRKVAAGREKNGEVGDPEHSCD